MYQSSFSSKEGSGNAIRDVYKKLRFRNHKERVIVYKQRISARYRSFQVQLQILGTHAAISDNTKVQARLDTIDLMLSQIVEAVGQRQVDKSSKGNPPTTVGTGKGVLISGYVRPALKKVQLISSSIPRGAVRAKPIMTSFNQAAKMCKQRCGARPQIQS